MKAAAGWAAIVMVLLGCGNEREPGKTSIQIHSTWTPRKDFQTDVAMIYGIDGTFEQRLKSFKDQGYRTEMMTGVAWGNYQDYVDGAWDGVNHMDDAQVRRDGTRVMHDPSTPYFVPSATYREYLKQKLAKAIDAGAEAVYLEEPEFWAFAGYSEGFKREFKKYYGEPWVAPHESVDARFRVDQLKYMLYRDTLAELFAFCKRYAREHGKGAVRCYVPTHSLISYSYIQMVSPMGSLMSIPDADGYIAQVWTGTARAPNTYRGITKERTFEMAYFEYAQMVSMVRPSGRTCYLLCDPIEDDPNHGWDDYEANYKRTLVAALMQSDAWHYEVAPWPDRVFERDYFATEVEARKRNQANPPSRVPISSSYAKVLLACFNELADMDPKGNVRWDSGSRGVGVLISDSMMFQRVDPTPSDRHLGNFFGLGMPLLKRGMPAKVVQLETLEHAESLKDVDVLLMTYEGMKPMKREYHERLARWVRDGGRLVIVDDFADPYNKARGWWNEGGMHYASPGEHLLEVLGVPANGKPGTYAFGNGQVTWARESPAALSHRKDGDEAIAELVRKSIGKDWRTQGHLILHRGDFVVAANMDETSSAGGNVTIPGNYVDLFDPNLGVVRDPEIVVGEVKLYRVIDGKPGVLASSSRVRDVKVNGHRLSFTSRGPLATECTTRLALPRKPGRVEVRNGNEPVKFKEEWDESSQTLAITYSSLATDLDVICEWEE